MFNQTGPHRIAVQNRERKRSRAAIPFQLRAEREDLGIVSVHQQTARLTTGELLFKLSKALALNQFDALQGTRKGLHLGGLSTENNQRLAHLPRPRQNPKPRLPFPPDFSPS